MGVYNPMAKMPDNCAVCREECRYRNITAHKRHKRCPLIEIKAPHGDLIDADKLRKEQNIWIGEGIAPTVIESELE